MGQVRRRTRRDGVANRAGSRACIYWGRAAAPVPVTENLAVSLALFRPVCDRFDYPSVAAGAHWDGHAQLTWETIDTDVVIGVQCSLTCWRRDVPETLEERIDIRDPSVRDLRAFLAQNGIAIRPPPVSQ